MALQFYVGPMSKNIVDCVIEFSNIYNIKIGLIPSRRQVDTRGGYVNDWTTEDFSTYVRNKSKKIELVRDHSGPSQGFNEDDGLESFINDCEYFDTIHVDVWKKFPEYTMGLEKTLEFIKIGHEINPNLIYEVGTEESIRNFEAKELDNLLIDLRDRLDDKIFQKIKYLVIQSGTALKENKNVGIYNSKRLNEMISISRKWNLISKEHNGDYVSDIDLMEKYKLGLNTINIAPEFGHIETLVIIDEIKHEKNLFDNLFEICLKSGRWIKWVDKNFNPEIEKDKLIQITGHYIFSTPEFMNLKSKLSPDLDDRIKFAIMNKLKKLHQIV